MAGVNGPGQSSRSTPGLQKVAADSSWIAAFEYDEANMTLTTILKSGAIYQHKDFHPAEWMQLQTAKSQSKHWSSAIKGLKPSVTVKSAKMPNSAIKTGR